MKRWRSARSLRYSSKENLTVVVNKIKIEDIMKEIHNDSDSDDSDEYEDDEHDEEGAFILLLISNLLL